MTRRDGKLKMLTIRRLIPLILVLITTGRSFGAAPPDEKPTRLVELLGADSFHEREQAHRKLLLLGQSAARAIEKGLRHPDLEIRRRCERIMVLLPIVYSRMIGRWELIYDGALPQHLELKADGTGSWECVGVVRCLIHWKWQKGGQLRVIYESGYYELYHDFQPIKDGYRCIFEVGSPRSCRWTVVR